jgi:hypothetical protein
MLAVSKVCCCYFCVFAASDNFFYVVFNYYTYGI